MRGELWKIINDYEPDIKTALELATLQQMIHEGLTEVYGANISYPHFLERKDNFHAALRATIREEKLTQ
jgi:hypothetical protein